MQITQLAFQNSTIFTSNWVSVQDVYEPIQFVSAQFFKTFVLIDAAEIEKHTKI